MQRAFRAIGMVAASGGCLVAVLLAIGVGAGVGFVVWDRSSGGPPRESTAPHLPAALQRDLPRVEYELGELCPAPARSAPTALRRAQARRRVQARALLRQLRADRDVAVLASSTVADVPAAQADVRQWTSLSELTRTHIDALRREHCEPALADALARALQTSDGAA